MPSLFLYSCLLLLATSGASAQVFSFRGLGFLPGGHWSRASGVSADGGVVVGSCIGPGETTAVRWTGLSGPAPLPPLFAGLPYGAGGISASGAIAVGYSHTPENPRAVLWNESGGVQNLGLMPGYESLSYASEVSADGSVVIGYGKGVAGERAYRWTAAGGMVDLGAPAGYPHTHASGVSADGSVIVGYGQTGFGNPEYRGFRWTTAGGLAPLPLLPGSFPQSMVLDVSADGQYAVGWSGWIPALWTGTSQVEPLTGLPGAASSSVYMVSGDGSVIVGTSVFPGEPDRLFVRLRSGEVLDVAAMLNAAGVSTAGWELDLPRDISYDGRTIVGSGLNPAFQTEAWILTIPAPASVLVWAVLLARRARRVR